MQEKPKKPGPVELRLRHPLIHPRCFTSLGCKERTGRSCLTADYGLFWSFLKPSSAKYWSAILDWRRVFNWLKPEWRTCELISSYVYLREGESGEGSKEGCPSSSLSSLCESVSRSPPLCYMPSHVNPHPPNNHHQSHSAAPWINYHAATDWTDVSTASNEGGTLEQLCQQDYRLSISL